MTSRAARSAAATAAAVKRHMPLDLNREEQANVRVALLFLHTRLGGWPAVARVLKFSVSTLSCVARFQPVSANLAFRIARFAGVSMDDLLAGRYPPAGVCAHCGQRLNADPLVAPGGDDSSATSG